MEVSTCSDPTCEQTYKWTEVAEAHKEMEANKTMGKIIVEIS
jgi:NADPH:quinone reductase-like Zn-dependent oxidoreductase